MYDHTNPDRNYAMLTPTDRQFLLSDGSGYDSDDKYNRKKSIIPRTRNALADFRLLAEYLPEEWRDEIFDAEPWTTDRFELTMDVAKAIQFMYVGLGGEGLFRTPLSIGVSSGEKQLSNVEHSTQAVPDFQVNRHEQIKEKSEVVNALRQGSFDEIEAPDLYTFIRDAWDAEAIDFDQLERYLELEQVGSTPDGPIGFEETVVEDGERISEMLAMLRASPEPVAEVMREAMAESMKAGFAELRQQDTTND